LKVALVLRDLAVEGDEVEAAPDRLVDALQGRLVAAAATPRAIATVAYIRGGSRNALRGN
jgi:hypothetical protein